MKTASIIIIQALAIILFSDTPAKSTMHPKEFFLLPESGPNFEKFMSQVKQKGLSGKEATIKNIKIEGNMVRLEMRISGLSKLMRLDLWPLGRSGALLYGKWFSIHNNHGDWKGHEALLQDLNKILDRSFPSNPWKPGWMGRMEGTLPGSGHGTAPLSYILIISLLTALLSLAGIGLCLKEKF